jgi:hypothetical protein
MNESQGFLGRGEEVLTTARAFDPNSPSVPLVLVATDRRFLVIQEDFRVQVHEFALEDISLAAAHPADDGVAISFLCDGATRNFIGGHPDEDFEEIVSILESDPSGDFEIEDFELEDAPGPPAVWSCLVFGGHGRLAKKGETWHMQFLDDELILSNAGNTETDVVDFDDITAIEIGGPGETTSGGGFIGGGFGLQGAAEGMLIATALNALTTRRSIKTIICLQTVDSELFLSNAPQTPDELRVSLSSVFTELRMREARKRTERSSQDGNAVDASVDRLVELASMVDRGLITEAEFQSLKAKLLD